MVYSECDHKVRDVDATINSASHMSRIYISCVGTYDAERSSWLSYGTHIRADGRKEEIRVTRIPLISKGRPANHCLPRAWDISYAFLRPRAKEEPLSQRNRQTAQLLDKGISRYV